MVSSKQSASRDYLSSSNVLIIVADINQLVSDTKTALNKIAQKYPQLPSMINIICGTAKDLSPSFNLEPSTQGHQQLFLLLTEDI